MQPVGWARSRGADEPTRLTSIDLLSIRFRKFHVQRRIVCFHELEGKVGVAAFDTRVLPGGATTAEVDVVVGGQRGQFVKARAVIREPCLEQRPVARTETPPGRFGRRSEVSLHEFRRRSQWVLGVFACVFPNAEGQRIVDGT